MTAGRFLARATLLAPLIAASASCSGPQSLSAHDGRQTDRDFSGVVALSNCSGAIVRFAGSKPDDRALVLTNGHCVEEDTSSEGALAERPSDRSFTLVRPGRPPLGEVRAASLAYATMSGTDIALYRLSESYAELEKRFDARAWTIAENPPSAGASIHIVSGYWRQKYACTIDGFAHRLKERDWIFADAIRYDDACDLRSGTSGAPVVDSTSRLVVGVNNTGNDGGAKCSLNNPCEIDENGRARALSRRTYGQQTYLLYGCLDAGNGFDFNRAGCKLPRPHPKLQ